MSDKTKTPQERYRDRNREKWNDTKKKEQNKNIKPMKSIERRNDKTV